jgi:trans-2-enoyl-CoA reductase
MVNYREDINVLKEELQSLGATHVLTYDELNDKKSIKAKVKEWTNGQVHASLK